MERGLPRRLAVEQRLLLRKCGTRGNLKPWFEVVTPHEDIRMGSLDESVFAANLNQVHFGQGREVYSNATLFFQKTYFTAGLSSIAEKVVKSLNGGPCRGEPGIEPADRIWRGQDALPHQPVSHRQAGHEVQFIGWAGVLGGECGPHPV